MKRIISLFISAVFILGTIFLAVSCGENNTPEIVESSSETSDTDTYSSSESVSSTEAETSWQESTSSEPETTASEANDTETNIEEITSTETEAETAATETEDITATETAATESETETSATNSETETETETSSNDDTTSFTGNIFFYNKAEDYADLDFAGKSFKIIYRWEPKEQKPSGWGFYFDLYEDADNPDDLLTSAVVFRRATIKEYYNCNVVGVPSVNAAGEASTSINTGSHEFDLVIAQYMLTGFGTSKMYYNLLPMINRDYNCWDEAIIRDYAFANKLYGITGDLSVSDDECLLVMLFNKDILDKNNLAYPYDLVRNGDWTLSKLMEMSRLCAKDLGGDGEIDMNDIFGTVMWADCWEFLYIGCGGRFISPIKADGTVDWAGNALGYEADIFNMCVEYLNDATTGGINPKIGVPDGGTEVVGSGRAAFFLSQLGNITWTTQLSFRDFENFHFGIVPVPKWNTEQLKYYSTFSTNIGLIGAPITGDYQSVANFLNVYALASQATIQKAYVYSVAYSYASDANVAEMLDIANAGRVWDYSLFTEQTVNASLTSDCGSNNRRWETRLKKGQSKIMSSAEKIIQAFQDNPY